MPALRISFDQREIDRAKKMAERWRGKPLLARMQKGLIKGGDVAARAIRSAAPSRTGKTRRSVRARFGRSTVGLIRSVNVGPTVRYAPPLIRGHTLVAWGNPTDRQVRGNPFVDAAATPAVGEVVRAVYDEIVGP